MGGGHRLLLSRLIWPTFGLFAATLCLLVLTIVWTGRSINDASIAQEQSRIEAVFAAQWHVWQTEILRRVEAAGLVDAAQDDIPARLHAVATRSAARREHYELADAEGRVLGRAAVARSARMPGGMGIVGDLGAPAALPHGGDWEPSAPVVVTPAPGGLQVTTTLPLSSDMPAESGAPIRHLRVTQDVDADMLDQLAKRVGIKHLEFRDTDRVPGAASVAIPGSDGAVALWWTPMRPGDLIEGRIVPLASTGIVVTSLLFACVAVYLRWVTRDLAQSQAETKALLGRDPLSGLANRRLFAERLDAALAGLATGPGPDKAGAAPTGLAVLFIDLDRFKDVNDTYGHQAGDDLIQHVAGRLAAVIRTTDTLARFGGDEFAIVQTGLRTPHDAEILARRILDALTRPFAIQHTQVTVGASIGIALAPQDDCDRENLMRLADTALYQAKSEGRNRYSLFQSRMDETIRLRKTVEEDLRHAIATDGLTLDYQPLYAADGHRIVGVEALVRWPHPTRGLISPGEFIPVAEERGLIIPLGEWVLRRACRDSRIWPDIRIAVNVSPIQFRHRDYVAGVMRVLEETGFDPGRLELELTEGVVVEDADAAEAAMMDLRALGVHMALDDFGTGYSSLIYLRRFAFDKIKIDRSFLESMEATGESAILVESIVSLGRALGLTVTAEGVETAEQHRFLQQLGCHQLQGFLFSPPVTREAIDRLLGIAEREPVVRAA